MIELPCGCTITEPQAVSIGLVWFPVTFCGKHSEQNQALVNFKADGDRWLIAYKERE